MKNKILHIDDLVTKVERLKKSGKVVVQSHGIFDLIHPGIIAHLDSAKKQGDVLIVSVVKDKHVKRGPGRPIFSEELRLHNVSSLDQVDYVCLVDDEMPFEFIKRIKPDIFARGQSMKDRPKKYVQKISKAERELNYGKTRIFETSGFTHDSSAVVKQFLDIYPEETKWFLDKFAKKHKFGDIEKKLDSLKDSKILIIGDGIIDEYHYCAAMSKSAKAHLVVNKYMNHEIFAGGVFAIANHVASLCSEVEVVSLLGSENSKEDFISSTLKPGINAKFFYREDGPTIVKKRYINEYLNQKVFEINYLNDSYVNGPLEADIVEFLKKTIPLYDMVMVADFGHGLLSRKIIRTIEETAKLYAVNTQTNGANAGYNMITKYHNPYYICLDEGEVRLATQGKFDELEHIASQVLKATKAKFLMVTRGKKGSLAIDSSFSAYRSPIFSSKVIDTVGAGDAVFAFTSPCVMKGVDLELTSFIGNAVGALAVQIVGNKKPVEKYELLEFVSALLK